MQFDEVSHRDTNVKKNEATVRLVCGRQFCSGQGSEEMYDDKDKMTKTQGERIMRHSTTGDTRSIEGGRIAEIMVDMAL